MNEVGRTEDPKCICKDFCQNIQSGQCRGLTCDDPPRRPKQTWERIPDWQWREWAERDRFIAYQHAQGKKS
jgi:hypothetical protein